MLKKIYDKYNKDNVDINVKASEFKDYFNYIIPGSKIKFINERRRYTCIARSDNFIIINKPFNLKKDFDGSKIVQYSILDLTLMKCNHDNLVFGIYDYSDVNSCKEALECLERSLIPWEERFDLVSDEECRNKLVSKYEGADDTLEISQRGWADLDYIIEQIWIEATLVR